MKITGIRPGEKLHEILVSEEECHRTVDRGNFYSILPVLPELRDHEGFTPALSGEFSSNDNLMDYSDLEAMLRKQRLMVEDDNLQPEGELLR